MKPFLTKEQADNIEEEFHKELRSSKRPSARDDLRAALETLTLAPPKPKRPMLPPGWSYASDEKQPVPKWGPCAYIIEDAEQKERATLGDLGVGDIVSIAPGFEANLYSGQNPRWLLTFMAPEAKP